MSFSWTGRQLDSVTKDGVTTTYTYDSNGLRTSKTTGDDVTEYTYLGSSLVYQVTNKGQSDEESLYFYYDEAGIAAFSYKSVEHPTDNGLYYYIRNPQGDILGIVDRTGTLIARYDYSAYGEYRLVWAPEEVPSEQIQRNNRVRNANPFDYRGYYYDTETGLYYCQSRYYDPEVDRFLNADTTDILVAKNDLYDKNLFAYCDNNPVIRYDTGGEFWHVLVGAVVGGLIGGISSIVSQAVSGQKINWSEVGVSAASGALTGAISTACPGMGALTTGIVHGAVGAGTHVATELVNGRTPTVAGTLTAGVTSGVLAGGTKAVSKALTTTKLYRSVSSAEAKNFSSTGKLSSGTGQMEGKFFATSKANAKIWGSKLGTNEIIKIRVPNSALLHSSVQYFPRLDTIGPAYYFSNLPYLNSVLIR